MECQECLTANWEKSFGWPCAGAVFWRSKQWCGSRPPTSPADTRLGEWAMLHTSRGCHETLYPPSLKPTKFTTPTSPRASPLVDFPLLCGEHPLRLAAGYGARSQGIGE